MNKIHRVGILGGSFNPPHAGHIHISKISIKKLKLDKLLWMVSPCNPFKEEDNQADFKTRYQSCKKLTERFSNMSVSDLEKKLAFNNTKKFYTYNLVKRYKTLYPNHDVYFILGADNLINLHKWFKFEALIDICNIVVIDRENLKYKAQSSKAWQRFKDKIKFINARKVDISSTDIRNSIS